MSRTQISHCNLYLPLSSFHFLALQVVQVSSQEVSLHIANSLDPLVVSGALFDWIFLVWSSDQ
jgi:hypothetical protein